MKRIYIFFLVALSLSPARASFFNRLRQSLVAESTPEQQKYYALLVAACAGIYTGFYGAQAHEAYKKYQKTTAPSPLAEVTLLDEGYQDQIRDRLRDLAKDQYPEKSLYFQAAESGNESLKRVVDGYLITLPKADSDMRQAVDDAAQHCIPILGFIHHESLEKIDSHLLRSQVVASTTGAALTAYLGLHALQKGCTQQKVYMRAGLIFGLLISLTATRAGYLEMVAYAHNRKAGAFTKTHALANNHSPLSKLRIATNFTNRQ